MDKQISIFAETEIAREGSPIFGWTAGLVKESCHHHAKRMGAATRTDLSGSTLKSITGSVLDDGFTKVAKSTRGNLFMAANRSRIIR